MDAELLGISREFIHLLTHQRLHVRFYRVHMKKRLELPYIPVHLNEISDYPVPRVIDRYMSAKDWI
jgi:hypothetical protein